MVDITLFLGAGASKPFRIPTMQEFVEEFKRELSNKKSSFAGTDEEINLYDKIQKILRNYNITPDLESTLTVLTDLDKGLDTSQLGPSLAYFIEDAWQTPERKWENVKGLYISPVTKIVGFASDPKAKSLLIKIKKFIRERCITRNLNDIRLTYAGLFGELAKKCGSYREYESLKLNIPSNIFTTNYDLCLEQYFNSMSISFESGMMPMGGRRVLRSNPKINQRFYSGSPSLYKLHGSINWGKEKGKEDVYELDVPMESGQQTFFGEHEENLMIYPIQEKYIYRDPFFYMFAHLKKILEDSKFCLVIGYSFRDYAITNIFIDSVKTNKNLRIILIGPQAESTISKYLSEIKRNIIPINEKFGGDETLSYLPDMK